MSTEVLTDEERNLLLRLARQSIWNVVNDLPLPEIDLEQVSRALAAPGATFVTLTRHGELRGCIGTLEAHQPLVQDVCEHAVAAAFEDYRFPSVREAEVDELEIEISRLTPPVELVYETPQDLPGLLCPGVDGVILRDGSNRATFLPQVWEKAETPEQFLAHLCMKMGAPPNLWQRKKLRVFTYQVEEFHE